MGVSEKIGGTSSHHPAIERWDFPWKRPSSYWVPPILGNPHIYTSWAAPPGTPSIHRSSAPAHSSRCPPAARCLRAGAPEASCCGPVMWRLFYKHNLGVSMAMGAPQKWMVYEGKSHLEMDDDWGYPYFRKRPNKYRYNCHKPRASELSTRWFSAVMWMLVCKP